MIDKFLLTELIAIAIIFSIALYFDLRYQRIPNSLCLLGLITGIAVQFGFMGLNGVGSALLGAGLAFIILFPLYMFRLLGAGDVKLMIAIGAFLTPAMLVWSLLYGLVFGAISSIGIALYRFGFRRCIELVGHYAKCLWYRVYIKPDTPGLLKMQIPYAPALAFGWAFAAWHNDNVQWLISSLRYSWGA
ncbi:prepilin peptidase [Thalassotalea sp. PS06]|uniref:A24 family peptidase n=1 Tax=Thalassotalea sp. PS06 TaxID=2594005 RepID=UPI001162F80B|nr:prepilin peptidase [Thalassotalea sp. PS06]QDP02069.1 prepilin peptidase [Thalassotalea sp. PS06]